MRFNLDNPREVRQGDRTSQQPPCRPRRQSASGDRFQCVAVTSVLPASLSSFQFGAYLRATSYFASATKPARDRHRVRLLTAPSAPDRRRRARDPRDGCEHGFVVDGAARMAPNHPRARAWAPGEIYLGGASESNHHPRQLLEAVLSRSTARQRSRPASSSPANGWKSTMPAIRSSGTRPRPARSIEPTCSSPG
jgi:hypothetical protein